MAKASRRLISIFLGMTLALSMVPAMGLTAFALEASEAAPKAASEVVTSQIGTTTWTLQDGVLTIAPTNGVSGVLPATCLADYTSNGYSDQSGWKKDYQSANKIVFSGDITFSKTSRFAFSAFGNLKDLALDENAKIQFEESSDCSYMFFYCKSLSDISVLSKWDLSNIKNIASMFTFCESLSDISPLAKMDASMFNDMSDVFSYCTSLSDISPLAKWDTSRVTNMKWMFNGCSSLTDLTPLADWDLSNVTRVDGMFSACSSLTDISPLCNWDMSIITAADSLFSGSPLTRMCFGPKWKTLKGSDLWTPTGGNFTGKWVSSDAANKGPLTTSQLVDGWDPATMAGTWVAETTGAASTVSPTGISVLPASATLTTKGATKQLAATVSPSNATDKTVTWTTSASSVATVSSTGLVTAVGNGTATITAKTTNGKTAACKVTVSIPVQPTGVTVSPASVSLASKGATRQLSATVSPSNATDKAVTWTSSNSAVAAVSASGLVTAVGNGAATIIAKTSNGKTATCKVTVSFPVLPTSVKINQGAFTLKKKGTTKALTATVSPSNASDKKVTWTSSNTAVVKVSSAGVVTATGKKNGTAYITAKTANGKTAKVKATVKIVYPTKVAITTKAFTLAKKGASKTVKCKLSGTGITDQTVTWSSSNAKVATVNSKGKVVAVANGTTTIKAKTANGKSAKVKVTVRIPSEEEVLAKEIFAAYNAYRASKGLGKVAWSGTMASQAITSAKKCASANSLEHTVKNRVSNYSDILQRSTWKMTATEAVNNWKNSTGHRKMMQCTTAKSAGVGVYRHSNGLWYYAIVYNFTGTNQNGS